MNIMELTSPQDFEDSYAVMHELRTHLTRDEYRSLLEEMIPLGYRLFAAAQEGKIVALAGVGLGTNLYYGRHMWIYDLVTTATQRAKGFGQGLLEHVEEIARAEGCDVVALSSGLERRDAHRFYEQRMGYERASFTFRKSLR
jgi:GNAT superfamily N-acetyltransferase